MKMQGYNGSQGWDSSFAMQAILNPNPSPNPNSSFAMQAILNPDPSPNPNPNPNPDPNPNLGRPGHRSVPLVMARPGADRFREPDYT